MTDLELLEIDPMTLEGDMLTKWEHAQKKAMRVNRTYEDQLKRKVEQSELEARDFKAKRDIKVANLDNMKATIEMEDLYEAYQLSLEKASARMKSIQEQFKPTESAVSETFNEENLTGVVNEGSNSTSNSLENRPRSASKLSKV